jgi:hypothetical protein
VNPIRFVRLYVKAHHIRRVTLVVCGVACALLFFVIGAGVRLLIGPVSLGPFAGSLSDALDRALPGITLKYDQAAIEWERDEGKVNLVILGTRVFDRDGRIIAQAPKADIDLAAGPFLHGKIDVKRIVLVGVQLTLVRTEDGGLRLGIGKDTQERDILKRISDALKSNRGSTTSLESFAIRHARLAFYDETTKLFLVAPRADFRLARAGDHLAAKIDAAVEISGHPAHVVADIVFPADKGPVIGQIAVTGFAVHSLAANSRTFAAVKDTALTLDLTGTFRFDGPRLAAADFDLSAKGAVVIPDLKDGLVRVAQISAKGRYDETKRRILLESAAIDSDKVKAHLQGKIAFVLDAAGAFAGMQADMRMSQLSLTWPGVFAGPVQFQLVDLSGAWNRASREFVIDRLGISGTPLAMQVAGRISLPQGQSPAVDVKGSIAPLSVRDLVRYWPLGAASGGREWVDANMTSGLVGPTAFEIHFPAGLLDQPVLPAGAISVKFTIAGGEIAYINGLTHLTEVQGAGTVTGTSFTADVTSGKIGPLAVTAAHFAIPDFNAPDEMGTITGHVKGAMSDVMTLVDMPPLHYAARFGVDPATSKGDAGLDLSFRVPMQKGVSVDKIGIVIKAAVSGFAVALGPHTQITDGNVAFQIDNNRLHATGSAGIGGSPGRLNVDWTEDFKTAKAATTRVAVKGTLDEAARAALNIRLKDYLKGPVGLSGTLTGHRGALVQGSLTLDLTPANLTVDMIGVNKPPGFPMTARITVNFGAKSTVASQAIRITGPGTSVTANLRYDAGEHLALIQAPAVRIGPQNDFSLNVTRGAAGTEVVIRGHSLDGSRMGRHGKGSEDETFDEPFRISARLDRMALRDGVAFSNFALDIAGNAERPASMAFSASLSKTATVTASITPAEAGRRISASTSDTGLLLHGLFGFSSMRGGKLDVSAMLTGRADAPPTADGPDYQGKATLKDFRVLNQPFLARLFSAGSLGGLVNLMQGQGIAVDALEVPFSSRNGVISVHDVRATGPAIGISADGYIDRPKNSIALKGSLVPMFGLNSVLGNIPLLGTVITSKEGEGIIGMTYSVTGNADEPNVSVNPLSALAPGILRRIFEGKMPNAAQAPSNAPKPAAPPGKPVPAPPVPAASPPKPQPKT